jgi:hypothetical protein
MYRLLWLLLLPPLLTEQAQQTASLPQWQHPQLVWLSA